MSKGPAPFTQAALTRALKAAKNAKYPLIRIEIRRDGIVMFPGEPEIPSKPDEVEPDEWAIPE